MDKRKYDICANCRKPVDVTEKAKPLCDVCVRNLPTAKENSRIKS